MVSQEVQQSPAKKPGVFYGYWIVVSSFFCFFIWSGCGFYSFSLFVKPIEADLGWSRGGIMTAFTIFYLITGVASPFVGRITDRHGVRGVIAVGAILSGLGFALLSLINDLWFFYLGYAITGLGMAAMGTVPATAAVSNWFKKRRGTAVGIMSVGAGIGGLVLAPLIGGYLIPAWGWRTSYLAMALLTWVLVIPLALFVIRTKPADMGLYPDGMEAPQAVATTEATPSAVEGLTLRAALATPALWLIGLSLLAAGFSRNGVFHNQVPLLEDIGFPVSMAATALGAVGLVSAISRFGLGWLCDRISAKYVWCISLGFHLVSVAALMSVGPTSPMALIWLYAVAMGFSMGGWLPAMSMLASTTFGLASYGAILGMLNFLQSLGVATGPLMAGYMYDIMNTYHKVFIIFLALCAVAIPLALAVRHPASSRGADIGQKISEGKV